MRRCIIWLTVGAPLSLVGVTAGATGAVPTLRHIAWGLWNVPDRLPALADNSQVHYQQGAEDYAHAVSDLLPEAIARIEAAHGRPFARPVTIGVYATLEAYAAANGRGAAGPVGVTFAGRVNLSPALYSMQRRRLPAILTHELSHAHIQGWISTAELRLPNWFKEGLAVMVSGGGGAEFVTEQEARAAIERGERIVIHDTQNLSTLMDGVRYDRPPLGATSSPLTVMAYRQAGMFVAYLHDSDGPAFARMMTAILDCRSFAEAVTVGYHEHIQSLWKKCADTRAERK